MNEIQMHDALTAFGRQVIYDIMELAACCDLKVAHESFKNLNMTRHVECIEYMFKAELNKKSKK